MNNKFKSIFLISIITGGIFGIISLVPLLAKFSVIILLTIIALPLVYLFKRLELIDNLNEKESLKYGALTGVFSTIGFGLIFYPIVYILSLFFKMEYLGGFGLMVKLMSFPLALMFIIFICVISAVFNAFSALMYYYVTESVKNLK